jgi:hypothetical protein
LTNILALIYILPILVFSFFLGAPNPVPSTMNWAILMLGGPVVLATVYYLLGGRKTYTPPDQTVDDYIVRYEAIAESLEKEMSSCVAKEIATGETVAELDAAEKETDGTLKRV